MRNLFITRFTVSQILECLHPAEKKKQKQPKLTKPSALFTDNKTSTKTDFFWKHQSPQLCYSLKGTNKCVWKSANNQAKQPTVLHFYRFHDSFATKREPRCSAVAPLHSERNEEEQEKDIGSSNPDKLERNYWTSGGDDTITEREQAAKLGPGSSQRESLSLFHNDNAG